MPSLADHPAPAVAISKQRKWRNFLLDKRFQLKFASYTVGLTLVVAGLLGVFLWRTTSRLFNEAQIAVDARFAAVEKSRDLGNAILSNELLTHMDDPAFEKQLREKSEAIDRTYEADWAATVQAREQLVRSQQLTILVLLGGLVVFIVFIALASIVTTHRIVGPLYRIKKMAQEVAQGKLHPPSYGLRPGDELQDVFEEFSTMISALRHREEDDLNRVTAALSIAEREKASPELLDELRTLQQRVKAKLD